MITFNAGHIIVVAIISSIAGFLVGWIASAMLMENKIGDRLRIFADLVRSDRHLKKSIYDNLTLIAKRLDERQIERDLSQANKRLEQIHDILASPDSLEVDVSNLSSDQNNQS